MILRYAPLKVFEGVPAYCSSLGYVTSRYGTRVWDSNACVGSSQVEFV